MWCALFASHATARPHDVIAAGLRPHHDTGSTPEDPGLFRHRFQHLSADDKLTYFEYEARRHMHVVFTDDLDVKFFTMRAIGENTVLTLTLNASSQALTEANLTVGSILVGEAEGCTASPPTGQPDCGLRERVTSEPHLSVSADGALVLTLTTSPASLHECFEELQIEYFSGAPDRLAEARNTRLRSLTEHEQNDIPANHFASSGQILSDVRGSTRRLDLTVASSPDLHPHPRLLAPAMGSIVLPSPQKADTKMWSSVGAGRPYRNLTTSTQDTEGRPSRQLLATECWQNWFGISCDNMFDVGIWGIDCSDSVPGQAIERSNCFFDAVGSSREGPSLKAGNTYTLRWRSGSDSSRVSILLLEHDNNLGFHNDERCITLASDLRNEYYTGDQKESPNHYTFTMPDVRTLSCVSDLLGFPEFMFSIESENKCGGWTGCHRGKSTWFRLLDETHYSQQLSLALPSPYTMSLQTSSDFTCGCEKVAVALEGDAARYQGSLAGVYEVERDSSDNIVMYGGRPVYKKNESVLFFLSHDWVIGPDYTTYTLSSSSADDTACPQYSSAWTYSSHEAMQHGEVQVRCTDFDGMGLAVTCTNCAPPQLKPRYQAARN